ncbi:hypothetical protein MTY81_41660 [Mycolicibacterium sp. TY81]|nr:hypothetical protein MTY81_41660 [Mycolicibacterium sp. TY81]
MPAIYAELRICRKAPRDLCTIIRGDRGKSCTNPYQADQKRVRALPIIASRGGTPVRLTAE